jgi:hypothetical protein
MVKATKSEVHYQAGMAKSHCGKSFKYEGTCEKVKGGIKAMYWYRLWRKAPSR